ncbi:asparagine synthase (glutamine-hydrolyzing) [Granulosicoccaceae sp. 1_MG-2023]|nr:asparagine synthase (glutamine-hydrolyzing) [Granulosicoccaceae sp. 1_MG-2023]
MCGISGYVDLSRSQSAEALTGRIRAMNAAMLHRGPDAGGEWVDAARGVALGHRRLSIIDLSPAGAQPMHSADERYVIVFNGEIYNFPKLRAELEQSGMIAWRGHSDTEVLLAAIVRWGVHGALQRMEGMFAFALYDRAEQTLTLGRDRLGEKPLYYGQWGAKLVFGSSLASFAENADIPLQLDRDSLALMMRHNYIPSPYSIYRDVAKLEPGCTATFTLGERDAIDAPAIAPYWSVEDDVLGARDAGGEATVDGLESLLNEVISQSMVSDVPVGAFLSGGVDSSLVTALMQANSASPVNTFSIGFTEDEFSEAEYAKQVAAHLGTHHTELYLSGQDALDVIPQLPLIYDEPFSDSSQIPTFLVSKMAREHVTVALSGDGGDELFCGYNRYLFGSQLRRRLKPLPPFARTLAGKGLTLLSIDRWNSLYALAARLTGRKTGYKNIGDKLHKAAEVIQVSNDRDLYRRLVSHWKQPGLLVPGAEEPPTALDTRFHELDNFIELMMALDTVSYLPGDILVKVDRAAMFNSLETRVPFLNHRVLGYAWRMPLGNKLQGGNGKLPLKEILYKHVPRQLIDRPKMGFGIPLGNWLRNELRDWADNLLDPARLSEQGVFDSALVQQYWQAHLSGKSNYQYYLWDVLMFQAWFDQYGKRVSL